MGISAAWHLSPDLFLSLPEILAWLALDHGCGKAATTVGDAWKHGQKNGREDISRCERNHVWHKETRLLYTVHNACVSNWREILKVLILLNSNLSMIVVLKRLFKNDFPTFIGRWSCSWTTSRLACIQTGVITWHTSCNNPASALMMPWHNFPPLHARAAANGWATHSPALISCLEQHQANVSSKHWLEMEHSWSQQTNRRPLPLWPPQSKTALFVAEFALSNGCCWVVG